MSDFPERWAKALADEAGTKVPLEVVVTCAYHNRVLEPQDDRANLAEFKNVWACPDPNCPVKAHITIRTPAQEA